MYCTSLNTCHRLQLLSCAPVFSRRNSLVSRPFIAMTTEETFPHNQARHDSGSPHEESSGDPLPEYRSNRGDSCLHPAKRDLHSFLPVSEPEGLALILNCMLRCQKHVNRNLTLIGEHLRWCQDCVSRLDAIVKSMDRAVCSTASWKQISI